LVYEAEPTPESYSFFSNGIPITVFEVDEAEVMFSASEENILGKAYIKVWLLYLNKTDENYLLEPYNFMSLESTDYGHKQKHNAKSPGKILSELEEQESVDQVLNTVGTALKLLSSKEDAETEIAVQHKINSRDISSLYNVFKESFNAGVLRKNTVFPGQSVNGFVYFPIEGAANSNDYGYVKTYIDELQFALLLYANGLEYRFKLNPGKIW
jgi:hypothetical protein